MPLSAQQTSDVKAQYDPARKRAQDQEAANLQAQKGALARRAAQLGGGPSGAMVKQESIATDASAKRLQDANEGINSQETGALNQAREVQAQRDYGTSERLGSQDFAHGERLGSQQYGTSERLGAQQYGTSERLGGQDFAHGERLSGQEFTGGQNQKQIDAQFAMQKKQIEAAAAEGKLSRDQANAQLAELKRQSDREFTENQKTNTINSVISGYNSKISPEAMGQILSALGIDVGAIPGLTAAKQEPAPTGAAAIPQLAHGQNNLPGASANSGTTKVYNPKTGRYEYK